MDCVYSAQDVGHKKGGVLGANSAKGRGGGGQRFELRALSRPASAAYSESRGQSQ
jgi:hypothetical protein